MLYPQYFIDDLKSRADIVRIIQPYAQDLKKKGSNWMACCPFHQEKTPSFSVSPAKGFYKCFGCGKGGSVYNFLMEMEGLNFPEAIERVAEMSGVMLPEPVDDVSYERGKKKREETKKLSEQIVELNQRALEFWEAELQADTPDAVAARAYLESRGISNEVQQTFHIGFAPNSWDALLGVLKTAGANDKIIEQSGLVSVNEDKDRVFDRFRGRIMFPVLGANGKSVAFGARAMGDDQPKYLNSPETAAYTKGQHLYGLFQAKDSIRKKKFAILVEGYLDLIALYQFGITNVAASLGTAFTPEQSKLLSRFAKRVVINYDGDSAGIKAARRAIEHLLPYDFDIKVLVLPDGKDPDDFVRENGEESYNAARGKAKAFLRFALETAVSGRNLNNAKQKAEAIEDFLPIISAIRNNIQRRESFDQAMAFFHVEDAGLRRELWTSLKNNTHSGDTQYITQRFSRAARARITIAERRLLELLVFDRPLRDVIIPQLEVSDYHDLSTAELFEAFVAIHNDGLEITPETILEHIGDDENSVDLAHELLSGGPRREVDDALDSVLLEAENCVFSLRNMAIANRTLEISREAALAEQAGDLELFNQLTYEQLELEKIRRELHRRTAEM
ncbi:MAG: DNA primase [Pyrinomonadaceae bacterium]